MDRCGGADVNISPVRVWRTDAGALVSDGDPDAAILVVGEGSEIDADVAGEVAEFLKKNKTPAVDEPIVAPPVGERAEVEPDDDSVDPEKPEPKAAAKPRGRKPKTDA